MRLSSLLTPESVAKPHNLPRCVSTPTSNEEIYLLRDYRPTFGVVEARNTPLRYKEAELRNFRHATTVVTVTPSQLIASQRFIVNQLTAIKISVG